jgi:hypothetical protein
MISKKQVLEWLYKYNKKHSRDRLKDVGIMRESLGKTRIGFG